jgi:hypothetical protein
MSGEAASGDGLEFIENATGMTIRATRVDDGWIIESDDGEEKPVTFADFEARYVVRAGGDS